MYTDSHPLKNYAISFLEMVASGKVREAYRLFIASNFKHHNPFFKGDAKSLMEAMEENALQHPTKILDVQRAIHEGNLVMVHSKIRQTSTEKGASVVHIFRFEENRIVELWDVGMATPPEMINENGMF